MDWGNTVLKHMKNQMSLSLALNHKNQLARITYITLGAIRDWWRSRTLSPFTISVHTSGFSPPSCTALVLDQVHTRDLPFVQYVHLPDFWYKSFLYRCYFSYEYRENHQLLPLPGWWAQGEGQSNQYTCKRGSSTLRYEFVILWSHLPSELQLSLHLEQHW